MKDNNLFLLDKFKSTTLNSGYISLIAVAGEDRNDNIYVSDKVDFDDDNIRKELKQIKIKVKDTILDDIKLPENEYLRTLKVSQSNYSFDAKSNKYQQTYYFFKLE